MSANDYEDERVVDGLAAVSVSASVADEMGAVPLHPDQYAEANVPREQLLRRLGRSGLAQDEESPESDYDSDKDERFNKTNKTTSKILKRQDELRHQMQACEAKTEKHRVTTYLTAMRQSLTDPASVAKYNMLYKIAELCHQDRAFMKEVQTVVDVRCQFVLCRFMQLV